METQHEFIQNALTDMLDSTIKGTVDVLKNISDPRIPAPVRIMLLERLSDSWNKSPVTLNVPKSLKDLCKYAHNNADFSIKCGIVTSFLLTVKNGVSYGNNNN
jgi:hypothetical protein